MDSLQTERLTTLPRMRMAPEAPVESTPAPSSATVEGNWQKGYVAAAVAVDVIAAISATAMALVSRFGSDFPPSYLWGSLAVVPLWIALVAFHRGYDRRVIGVGRHEFTRVARAGASTLIAVALLSWATNVEFGRGYVLIATPAVVVLAVAGRCFQRSGLRYERRKGRCLHRTVLIGPATEVRSAVNRLSGDLTSGVAVVGACVTDGPGELTDLQLPIRSGIEHVEDVLDNGAARTVIVLPNSGLTRERLRRLAWRLEPRGAELLVCAGLSDVAERRLVIRPIADAAMLHLAPARPSGAGGVAKAAFDRLGAAAGLLVTSPLLLGVAFAIWIKDRGNPVFRQVRVGRHGKEFRIYKFRTMVVDAERLRAEVAAEIDEDPVLFKVERDPRITPLGRWLRKFSIDELPQLINVLRGEMSLVGPRPAVPDEVATYSTDMRRRERVKPGMTGLWQVSGRSDLSWEDRERLDIAYVENWSLGHDLAILARTAKVVLRPSGAY